MARSPHFVEVTERSPDVQERLANRDTRPFKELTPEEFAAASAAIRGHEIRRHPAEPSSGATSTSNIITLRPGEPGYAAHAYDALVAPSLNGTISDAAKALHYSGSDPTYRGTHHAFLLAATPLYELLSGKKGMSPDFFECDMRANGKLEMFSQEFLSAVVGTRETELLLKKQYEYYYTSLFTHGEPFRAILPMMAAHCDGLEGFRASVKDKIEWVNRAVEGGKTDYKARVEMLQVLASELRSRRPFTSLSAFEIGGELMVTALQELGVNTGIGIAGPFHTTAERSNGRITSAQDIRELWPQHVGKFNIIITHQVVTPGSGNSDLGGLLHAEAELAHCTGPALIVNSRLGLDWTQDPRQAFIATTGSDVHAYKGKNILWCFELKKMAEEMSLLRDLAQAA